MSKNYANEHPRNKKNNQDKNIKVASSNMATRRKRQFEAEVRELYDIGGQLTLEEMRKHIKYLEKKIRGR